MHRKMPDHNLPHPHLDAAEAATIAAASPAGAATGGVAPRTPATKW